MTTTKVIECAFNDYWSLVWDHHNGDWALTHYYDDGDEAGLLIGEGHLEYLKELLLMHSTQGGQESD